MSSKRQKCKCYIYNKNDSNNNKCFTYNKQNSNHDNDNHHLEEKENKRESKYIQKIDSCNYTNNNDGNFINLKVIIIPQFLDINTYHEK